MKSFLQAPRICYRLSFPEKAFLEAFVQRLKVERLEELDPARKKTSTPMFDIIHGIPGAGKSRVISWMRELMESGLGWKHGVEFVCLAFQNAMAALINGYTIHHWSGIPACATAEGGSGFGDSHKLSTKCQALRIIVLDELSMVSAELLGALEYVVKKVIRSNNTYKVHPDGSIRVFGGVNVIACVDWWQLPPVGGIGLSSNPSDISEGIAQDAMRMLWDTGPNSVQRTWCLEQPMRC